MSGVNPTVWSETLELINTKLARGMEIQGSPLLAEFVLRGFEQKLSELYEDFQQGEISLGYLAEQLGISPWEAVHLLKERGLRTTNL